MNMQQVVQPRSSSNGYGRRKIESDATSRSDKIQSGKTFSSKTSFGKGGSFESPSLDRLLFFITSFIGQQVEVQVVDGSVYSGIFHATNSEDFGVVLKMAHLIKDGSRGSKNISDFSTKSPYKTLIIPSNDLVQVIGKEVHVSRDGLANELQHERQLELLTDSCISQARLGEVGRELGRWIPDENDPDCPELENIFDDPWNRGWDQFQANATLFGVKSTFNEDLYTTKLERGPQTRELEREAMRIAKEIEGEDTLDLHLAEERGIELDGSQELDEETRFSSVRRADDSGYDETEDILLDSRNDETFGDASSLTVETLVVTNTGKNSDGTQGSLMGELQSCVSTVSRGVYHPKASPVINASRVHDNQFIMHAESSSVLEDNKKKLVLDHNLVSKTEDSDSVRRFKKDSFDEATLSPSASAFEPSHVSSKGQEKASSSSELPNGALPPKTQGTTSSLARPSSSASSTSERGGATSTSASRGLSPSSSVNSLTSEKSTLNPHAKEFKLNPNAKSFVPSPPSLRPSSPAADSPFYYPANVASMTQMHAMPAGITMGSPFAAQQHIMFNPQALPMPQPYYHPGGPQYAQQMLFGQPRPVMYMPAYPTEMPYKGREF